MERTLVRVPRTIATLAGPKDSRRGSALRELSLLSDGAILVENGTILKVGTREQLQKEPHSQEMILDGVVLPGLIDCHTHAAFCGNRYRDLELRQNGATYQEIAAQGGGIQSTVKATRDASEEEVTRQLKRHLEMMWSTGTVAAEIKSGYGLTLQDELKLLRAIRDVDSPVRRTPTFLGAHAVPKEFEGPTAYLESVINEMLPVVIRERLANAVDIFVENNYFTSHDAEELARAAKRHGLELRLHVDQLSDGSGAELASRLKAWTADHLEQTQSTQFKHLADSETIAVLLPESVQYLGLSKYADARGMIDSGIAVAIASDFNPGSSPVSSLPWIMHLAVTCMKMHPYEAISACTVNAAYATGFQNDLGTIEAGKRAIFAQFDAEFVEQIPVYGGSVPVRVVAVS